MWVYTRDDTEHGKEYVLASDAEAEIASKVAAERERCAKIAEQTVCDTHLPTGIKIYGTRAAAAIRGKP